MEDVTGARLTISYGRVGGVKADLPDGFEAKVVRKAFKETREVLDEVHRLLTGNRIFMDRMVGVGALSREETIAYGITGPLLRAVGVPYDVRRAAPHWAYDNVEFEVVTQKDGDNYARYLVRMAEMEQSMRIAEEACADDVGPSTSTSRARHRSAAYVDQGKQKDREYTRSIRMSPTCGQRSASGTRERRRQARVLPPKDGLRLHRGL